MSGRVTNGQRAFLLELKGLDDIGQGMLAPSIRVRRAQKIEDQALARNWVRSEPRTDVWRRTLYLTTKGLRASQKELTR